MKAENSEATDIAEAGVNDLTVASINVHDTTIEDAPRLYHPRAGIFRNGLLVEFRDLEPRMRRGPSYSEWEEHGDEIWLVEYK